MLDLMLLSFSLLPWFLDCLRTLVFFPTLFKAHLGYLHNVRACWIWSCSSFSCCFVEHTSFALWNKVLMTLYLADIEWWLSHCKYWFVWVGFLYTDVDKVPSVWGVTRTSKKGKDPSAWVSSAVNWMLSSNELIWLKNSPLCDVWMTTKVSSTNLSTEWGVGCCAEGFGLKLLHVYVCNDGA